MSIARDTRQEMKKTNKVYRKSMGFVYMSLVFFREFSEFVELGFCHMASGVWHKHAEYGNEESWLLM